MILSLICISFLSFFSRAVLAQYAFAHIVVGINTAYTLSDWEFDIRLASGKGLDAFVLNICPPLKGTTSDQVGLAFQAAENVNNGFQLFFSFDYTGSGQPWATQDIITMLSNHIGSSVYFNYDGRPFVSTFMGPSNSDVTQWATIRDSLYGGIYFIPDWTTEGPNWNADLYDGAFSWDMWPDGPNNMTTVTDVAWQAALQPAGQTYMMGIAPWFYTDLPAYDKAWVWRGDSLWHDRWQQAVDLKPDFVEIYSWNDYGETNYIGPIHRAGIPSYTSDANATYYVEGYHHKAWLQTLPYQIAAYKNAVNPANNPPPRVEAGNEKIVYWYRTSPASAGTTEATGNHCPSPINAGGYQICYPPDEILVDGIFAIALLSEPGTVSIGVGSNAAQGFGGLKAGLNFVSRPFNGETGRVHVSSSNGDHGVGRKITAEPATGVANFNAWVGCAGNCD